MTSMISTTDLAEFLHRSLTADESGAAIMAVDAASELVRDYCGVSFTAAASQTLVMDGHGTHWLLLPETPVTALTSVTLYDGLDAETLLVEGADEGYTWDAAGRLYRVGVVWPKEHQSVTVVYSYGYGTIPASVRMVAVQVAARIFVQGIVRQESIGGYSVSYAADAAFSLTPAEERVLSRHRQRRLGL